MNRMSRFRPTLRGVLPLLLASVLALGSHASAQFEGEPFFERPDDVRLAYTVHAMEARLIAMSEVARQGEVPEDLGEQAEELAETDIPRLAGSLAEADADLLERLRERVEAVEDAFESGDPGTVIESADAAMDVTGRALDALIGAEALADPELRAALMARLLLGEPGAAEGYEEAFEERWEFAVGWAVLQQLHELWDDLAPAAGDLTDDFEESLAALGDLMPQATPPDELIGDPEDSEGAAHDAVAYLEQITEASLHPDRDLGRLAGHLVERTGTACTYYENGESALGLEYALSVQDQFEHLEDTAATLLPDAAEGAEEALGTLAQSEVSGDERRAACEDAAEALEQIRAMLGG